MAGSDEEIEQTLHVAASVLLFQIPPRGPTGHVSGEWRVTDKIFEGRLRVVSKGEQCSVEFEDSKGDLFAECPVPYGKRGAYVEPAVDSSRNFVVRVEDPATKQHAFLGMSFTDRSDSFDFNEALLRHEKHVERERAARSLQHGNALMASTSIQAHGGGSGKGTAAEQAVMREVQTLYTNHDDYTLKEGQTIKVNIQKRTPKPGGLLSSAAPGIVLGMPPPPGTSHSIPGPPTSTLNPFAIPPPPGVPHSTAAPHASASGGMPFAVLPPSTSSVTAASRATQETDLLGL